MVFQLTTLLKVRPLALVSDSSSSSGIVSALESAYSSSSLSAPGAKQRFT